MRTTIFVNGEKAFLIVGENTLRRIDGYQAFFKPTEGEAFCVSADNDYSFMVVSVKGKVYAVLVRENKSEEAEPQFQKFEPSDAFEGKGLLCYRCSDDLTGAHVVFIDTVENSYRNMNLDMFGFEDFDIITFLKSFFSGLRPVVGDISQEKSLDLFANVIDRIDNSGGHNE
jgi:hypothetical protein